MASDVAYIVNTWVSYLLKPPHAAVLGERPAFQLTWRTRRLLNNHGARVACDAEDHDTILGFACVTPATEWHVPLFLWAYVREDFRRQGIAKSMLGDLLGAEVVSATRGPEWGLPSGWKHMEIAERWALLG